MASRHPLTGEKLVEGENADYRDGKLRARMPELDIGPALKSLDAYASTIEGNLPGQEAQLESEADITIGDLETERDRGLGQLDLSRQEQEQGTKAGIAESRRIGDELLTGLQARFGGGTGTGLFAGELTGRQVAQNISQQRVALTQAISRIDQAKSDLNLAASEQLAAVKTRLANAKETLRAEVRERIAQINIQKGMLEVEKSRAKMDVMQQAMQVQASMVQQERAFEQQMQLQVIQSAGVLDSLKEQVANSLTGITDFTGSNKVDVNDIGFPIQSAVDSGNTLANVGGSSLFSGSGNSLFA